MKNMTLRIMQEVTGGKLYNARDVMDEEVSAIISDSRKVSDNSVFLCIKGEHTDGHRFAQQVIDNGALAVISERRLPELTGPYLLVESVLQATQQIAEYYRRVTGVKVVGVTGSVGKTSTKEFIAAVLSKKYRVHKTKGNFNNQWGVPFTIFGIDERAEVAVIEMGISDHGEMDELARMARPNIAVITNIGESHLEFFGTREGILQAKSEIFNYMDSSCEIVLNGDDDKLSTILSARGIKPSFFGMDPGCALSAEKVVDKGLEGTEFDMIMRDGGGKMSIHITLPVPGVQNIYNALAAADVGLKMGISPMQIKAALAGVKNADGRGNIIKTENFMILDDCYNASPKSMESSIDMLLKMPGRKVAILGDMKELGEMSDKLHFRVGKYAAKAGVDVIICVGSHSEKTYMAARMSTDNQVELFQNKDECIDALPDILEPGDSILVKASNAMKFSAIVDELKEM
ncbi:MAG: UDP-N-acetylmuramoyl-tripeptide--D-alanyl-D-alanine ligase [Parasporobacterium sp.]|nr:UDP-N-acetylmuramoyl-tripeptide--D-alanyl-D-alanine ligase [Parasporobacterium sp.]